MVILTRFEGLWVAETRCQSCDRRIVVTSRQKLRREKGRRRMKGRVGLVFGRKRLLRSEADKEEALIDTLDSQRRAADTKCQAGSVKLDPRNVTLCQAAKNVFHNQKTEK